MVSLVFSAMTASGSNAISVESGSSDALVGVPMGIAAAARDGMSREPSGCIYEARRDPGGQHIAEALHRTREGSR